MTLLATTVLCDEGDLATGGGVTGGSSGSSGPFLLHSGPELDEFDQPIGWRISILDVSSEIELHAVCVATARRPVPLTTLDPPTLAFD